MTSRGENLTGRGSTRPRGLHDHIGDWELVAVDYLDGRLSPEDKDAVEKHLADCPPCAARMAEQQDVVTYLQRADREEAPDDLEDRVLGELLFPSTSDQKPAFRGIDVERKSSRPGFRRRFRPWIPAVGMVLAVFVGMVVYGAFTERHDPTVAQDTASTARVGAQEAKTPADGASADPPYTVTPEVMVTSTTAPSIPPDPTAGPGEILTTASFAAEFRDQADMLEKLETSGGVVYLAFEALPDEDSFAAPDTAGQTPTAEHPGPVASHALPQETADQVATQITGFTQLQQLPPDLSLGGPTFAALVGREHARPFLDLLFSIEASYGVDLVLRMEPAAGYEANADAIAESRAALPVVVADRLPQPSVNNFGFTTSTLAPAGKPATEIDRAHEDAPYVLVVIYIARQ